MILGGGPNRIGQGIEFDYCCVHAVFALRDAGFETIMVNCNPETVSTDYDTSDRLYFEPLTLEDVLEIVEKEKPCGVVVQFGGQTPLKLAVALEQAGVPIIGTPPDAIDMAEDRERFEALLERIGLERPAGDVARSAEQAERIAARIGYPVLVRPSYVLGGRAMQIVQDVEGLRRYMRFAVRASEEHPVLVDRFLADAIEVDVDAICDGERVVVGGIMEHIEEAGIHSGDSACSLPPYSLSRRTASSEITVATRKLALAIGVRGLMNVQYAVKDGRVYVIEVNPRASRTVPFVSKAIGVPLAKLAALVMAGQLARGARIHAGDRAAAFLGEGGRLPLRQVPGRRRAARARDEEHGRGHGHRLGSSGGPSRRPRSRRAIAFRRRGRCSCRSARKSATRLRESDREARGRGLPRRRDARDGAGAADRWGSRPRSINKVHEGSPHTADKIAVRRDRARHQHRRTRPARRRRLEVPAAGRAAAPRAVLHDAGGRARSADAILALRAERIGVRSLQQIHELDARAAGRPVSGRCPGPSTHPVAASVEPFEPGEEVARRMGETLHAEVATLHRCVSALADRAARTRRASTPSRARMRRRRFEPVSRASPTADFRSSCELASRRCESALPNFDARGAESRDAARAATARRSIRRVRALPTSSSPGPWQPFPASDPSGPRRSPGAVSSASRICSSGCPRRMRIAVESASFPTSSWADGRPSWPRSRSSIG